MRARKKPTTYHAYALIYDVLKGDRSYDIALVREQISKHHPKAVTLLDVACGTGTITHALAKHFTVSGVDASPDMLQFARKKLPHTDLVLADMRTFRLNRTFDVACCLHNSLNHLITKADWEKTFERIAAHLKPGGIFIADVNTIQKMDERVGRGMSIYQVGDNYFISQVLKDEKTPGLYEWQDKILFRKTKDTFRLVNEPVKIKSLPLEDTTRMLMRYFEILDLFTLGSADTWDNLGRTYYVCAKK